MRFAYADPPYIGQARKHYLADVRCAEVDHVELITRLNTFDGWALSASSPSLKIILPMCPPDVRIGAWVKPFAFYKKGVNPAYAWEPVIFRGGRKIGPKVSTVRDWVSANVTRGKGCAGAKPEAFYSWIFDVWNIRPDDEFHDLFPGSGAVGRAWEAYRRQVFGAES